MNEIEEEIEIEIEQEYDITLMNNIRDKIESMSKFNQIEVLRIINNHKEVIINENKYGIHINLSELNSSIIEELKVYISYVQKQELELSEAEQQKENYKNIYFVKDNKENNINKSKYTI